jgi:hypothetical protein
MVACQPFKVSLRTVDRVRYSLVWVIEPFALVDQVYPGYG